MVAFCIFNTAISFYLYLFISKGETQFPQNAEYIIYMSLLYVYVLVDYTEKTFSSRLL